MALDFPANPTDGQVYGTYIYSSSSGVWKAAPSSATVSVVSPTKPTTANAGDIWVDSSDGVAYFYYYDGTGYQWVELMSSGVPQLASKADLTGATFTGNITAPQIISTTATGTAPLTVSSTTTVNNLSADLLDGQHGTFYAPTGMITQFAGATAPNGWLICDGTAVSRTTYAALFSVIGTSYGAGNGSSTFGIPDLRGRVPVGKNSGTFGTLGNTGGTETHTLTTTEMPSHQHSIYPSPWNGGYGGAYFTAQGDGNVVLYGQSWGVRWVNYGGGAGNFRTWGLGDDHTSYTDYTGSSGAHNNLQPYMTVNHIIKT